jgi:hypothetical protein
MNAKIVFNKLSQRKGTKCFLPADSDARVSSLVPVLSDFKNQFSIEMKAWFNIVFRKFCDPFAKFVFIIIFFSFYGYCIYIYL